nr:DUF1488 family protein [Escherichia coli]
MFSRSREWYATDMRDLWRESGVCFTGDTPEQWLASFRQHRWDLEEEAENLIQEQSEDDQGWVWLP